MTDRPTTALVLGGADCLRDDIDRYLLAAGEFDGVVACNDAGFEWAGDLDAWVSLHPEKFNQWAAKRESRGYTPPRKIVAHRAPKSHIASVKIDVCEIMFPGQKSSGSSGLYAAKVALLDLGFDRAVLCGIPMAVTPHFWDEKRLPWKSATGFRRQWLTVPQEYRARLRSMSGWSRALLGGPEWIKDL